MRDTTYYTHRATGKLVFNDYWWARVWCDQEIVRFYAWLCLRHGIPLQHSKAHISFIKGEEPLDKTIWNKDLGPIEFYYTGNIRTDNGFHAWLDVWSDQLLALRADLGLPPKLKQSYHLTIGRL